MCGQAGTTKIVWLSTCGFQRPLGLAVHCWATRDNQEKLQSQRMAVRELCFAAGKVSVPRSGEGLGTLPNTFFSFISLAPPPQFQFASDNTAIPHVVSITKFSTSLFYSIYSTSPFLSQKVYGLLISSLVSLLIGLKFINCFRQTLPRYCHINKLMWQYREIVCQKQIKIYLLPWRMTSSVLKSGKYQTYNYICELTNIVKKNSQLVKSTACKMAFYLY